MKRLGLMPGRFVRAPRARQAIVLAHSSLKRRGLNGAQIIAGEHKLKNLIGPPARRPKLRKLSMKSKTFCYLALVGLSLCAVLNWSCRSNVFRPKLLPMKTANVRQTLAQCSSQPEIQAEVDGLFIRFGDKDWRPLDDTDFSATSGLARFGKALSVDPLWDIVPSGYHEIGMPSHVELRLGQHFHYQYILFFRTGSDLSSIKSPFEQVSSNVYFKP